LSAPSFGWKSTSMPRSLKICTAAEERASEMRTRGAMACFLYPPLEGEGRPAGPGWGESKSVFCCGSGMQRHPTPPPLRGVDPPPPGEGKERSGGLRQRGLRLREGPIEPGRERRHVRTFDGAAAPDAQAGRCVAMRRDVVGRTL